MTATGSHQAGAARFTSGELAARFSAELRGPGDIALRGVESLALAGPADLSFIRDARFWSDWSASRCGAALVSRQAMEHAPDAGTRALIIVPDADAALIGVLALLAPPKPLPAPGVHPSALIDPSARISPEASIGPNTVIGPRSTIGPGTVLQAGVTIGAEVSVGAHCTFLPGVVVMDRCEIGDHVILHPGVVIGADGFGYYPDPATRTPAKIPHIGRVVIENHVEVGANTTIDRAKFGETRIGAATKIDNLVQIGHNCRIGRCCIICGMTGLAGSVTLGDGVTLAGRVSIADNRTIGSGATVGGSSGVMDDIPAGETWLGAPARPARETMRILASLDRLPDLASQARRMLKSQEG